MNFTANFMLYIICSMIISVIMGKLPVRWFGRELAIFRMHSFENDGEIYNRVFGISIWKDDLPEIAQMTDMIFSKKKLDMSNLSPEYIQTFINETRRAEMTHFLLILLGIPFWFANGGIMGLFLFIIAFAANFPFLILQRYNRPRFQRLLITIEKREAKKRKQLCTNVSKAY